MSWGSQGGNDQKEDKMEEICATCKFAKGFTVGPGISGSEEGVNCTNSELARYLDKLQEGDSYQREFNEYGFISLFRVEAVATDRREGCQFWEAQNQRPNK